MTLAAAHRAASPTRWPWVSLNFFKVVEVDHEQGQRAALGTGAAHQFGQHVGQPGAVVQAGQGVVQRELAVELAELLAPAQQGVGGADAEGHQAQQVARHGVRMVDQFPGELRFDHQQARFFHRVHGVEVGGIVQHRLLAHAFARQDAVDVAVRGAGMAIGLDLEHARQHDIQPRPHGILDRFAGGQLHHLAIGQRDRGGGCVGAAKQLQVLDRVARIPKWSDKFQNDSPRWSLDGDDEDFMINHSRRVPAGVSETGVFQ
jgi:hypothetical protein